MMTILYDFKVKQWLKRVCGEHTTIFQNYCKGKYKATHKRVKDAEFWHLPKIFIYPDHVGIVTGNQECKGGYEYIRHCKTFEYSVDRINQIVFLKKKGTAEGKRMRGIFQDGKWYENTDLVCRGCKRPVYESELSQCDYHCFCCGKTLGISETEAQSGQYLPPVAVARPVEGITINSAIEYLLDATGEKRVFPNQPTAEAFLLANGYTAEELGHVYFVETGEAEDTMENSVSYSADYLVYETDDSGTGVDPIEVSVGGYESIEKLKDETTEVILKTLQSHKVPDGEILVDMTIERMDAEESAEPIYEDTDEFGFLYQDGKLEPSDD